MDYKEKYNRLLDAIKELQEANPSDEGIQNWVKDNVPELAGSEDERIRKSIIAILNNYVDNSNTFKPKMLAWLEKQCEPQDKGEISDGYHTFNELYYYRMLYNAAFFNLLPKAWVHKSKKHHDGEECFGGGWFIVMANLPTGQISNHYELKYWELFHIPKKDVADEWDGHTPKEAAERLHEYLLGKQGEKISVVDFKAEDWYVSKVDGKIYNAKFIEKIPSNQDRKLEIEKAAISATGIIEQEEWFIKGAEWADENPSCVQIENQTDKVETKFHEGDWITDGQLTCKILRATNKSYELHLYNDDYCHFETDAQSVNEHYHLWSIEDAKDGDVLCCKSGWTCIFKALDNHTNTFSSYCFMDSDNWFYETGSECHTLKEEFIKAYNGKIYPATKEQRDLLFAKMTEAGYEWDADHKELKKIEMTDLVKDYVKQKPAWSEEDEERIKNIFSVLDVQVCWDGATGEKKNPYQKEIEWLKSLKQRIGGGE